MVASEVSSPIQLQISPPKCRYLGTLNAIILHLFVTRSRGGVGVEINLFSSQSKIGKVTEINLDVGTDETTLRYSLNAKAVVKLGEFDRTNFRFWIRRGIDLLSPFPYARKLT